ncbi:3-oxoacyl-[acyl-carrier-protein] reductase FabG-like [Bactrocera neohumeralis]|uniref:3-oxoacyl-[acyl-carrier-protein] reductase FabG-like n=1 Tax=Bactrocera neohumeralis TaxID=98809 RepID=UPI002164FCCE|nr:3-oxoacyl-[acyl-carrier-protein] reductase FabG-like [Bactrocera neohumeralis]
MSLAGKVVIVTGASSGIGAATAEAFAKQGSKVVLTGRNEANLKATEVACKAANSKVELLLITADVTTDAERIIKTAIDKFGQLDVLVNNAGFGEGGSILDIEVDQFDRVMNTNLRSIFLLTKFAAPHLVKSQGNIVNVSSGAGLRSYAGLSAYCTSKAALDQFTRCIALDLAPKNVRVNGVNPGMIVTKFYQGFGVSEADYVKHVEHAKTMYPLGRAGEPKEVADVIIFLASDSSSFITGANLLIDGGKHTTCPI